MGSSPPSASERAEALAQRHQIQEAVTLLASAAEAGDADAAFTLAVWALSGRIVRRDLELSRECFRRSGALGRADAEAIHIAFLANGTGGARDWPAALDLLRQLASRDPAARRQVALVEAMALTSNGDPVSTPAPERLSDSPHVQLFRGFFSRAECDYLVEAALPLFEPSDVVDPATGRLMRNPVRTSDAAAFPFVDENPAIHALNRRIAAASGTSAEQGEPLQVLRYAPGQEYRPHSDALPGADNQRLHTMLVYLNDRFEGGETHFLANDLKVRGSPGDAVLFTNAAADGRPDPNARHAGLPVLRGTKIIASRWIRAKPLDLSGAG